jgi:hypothetical protein
MGLDLVELVMAVEERFDITLSDDEAVAAETPGKLVDLIYRKLGQADPSGCLTRRAFFKVRKALMQSFECRRRQIAPSVRLEDLIPRPDRRARWQRLRSTLQMNRWEPLRPPAWLGWLLCGLGAALVALVLRLWSVHEVSLWLALTLAGAVYVLAGFTARPWCLELPIHLVTVGELTRYVVAYGPKLFEVPRGGWSRADIAAAVRELTIVELGIRPGDYREDAHFVKDLGAS